MEPEEARIEVSSSGSSEHQGQPDSAADAPASTTWSEASVSRAPSPRSPLCLSPSSSRPHGSTARSPRSNLLSRDKKVEAIIKQRKATQMGACIPAKDAVAGGSAGPTAGPLVNGREREHTLSAGGPLRGRATARGEAGGGRSATTAEPVKRGTLLTAFQSVIEKFSAGTPASPQNELDRETGEEADEPERDAEMMRIKRWETPTEEDMQAVLRCQRLRRQQLARRQLVDEIMLATFHPSDYSMRRRRQKVIDEIITTEVSYIANLEYCRDNLLVPLRRLSAEEKWRKLCPSVTVHDIGTMFSNLEKLIPLNQALLETLLDHMTRADLPPLQSRVGHIFSEYAPQFKFYSIYITNYHLSIDTLKKCEKNKYFCQVVRELGLDIGEGSVQLKSFLIMPIQRIPRYELFLRDVLKYTPEDHYDREKLKQALRAIVALASELDVNKVKIDNMEKLLEISQNISKAPFNIVEPTRRLIREGVLRKLWGHGGSLSNFVEMNSKKQKGLSAEEYTFFLFNDLLLFVRPKVATTSGLVAQKGQHPKNSYRYVNSFSWDSRVNVGHAFEVADIPESDVVSYAFRLLYKRCADGEVLNELALAASSIEEKREWMQDIDAQIKTTLSSRMQGLGSRVDEGGKDSALAPICFGFLSKRGGKRKSWKRRYFQLKGNTIFYFAEPEENEALGRIWLPEYRLEVAPRTIVGSKEFCFCLFHQQGGRHYYFEADSLEELNKWVEHIQTCRVLISEGLRQYLADAASSYQSLITT